MQLDPLPLMHTRFLLFCNQFLITANNLPPIPCFLIFPVIFEGNLINSPSQI